MRFCDLLHNVESQNMGGVFCIPSQCAQYRIRVSDAIVCNRQAKSIVRHFCSNFHLDMMRVMADTVIQQIFQCTAQKRFVGVEGCFLCPTCLH